MPRGMYVHIDLGDSVEERFSCAPGAGGWRYVGVRSDGVRTDLTVDGRWRQIRVEVASPDWWVRGGLSGAELLWVRGPAGREAAAEGADRAAGFLGESPGFLIAVARTLRLEEGAQSRVRVVQVRGTVLATLTTDLSWRRTGTTEHATETGPLPVTTYEIADLATGEITEVHLAGDVVLQAPGIELAELDTPPTLQWPGTL